MKGWLSCMKHCSFLLGNTSSGFVEALYFPKKVINLGVKQQGRIITKNIINCAIKKLNNKCCKKDRKQENYSAIKYLYEWKYLR